MGKKAKDIIRLGLALMCVGVYIPHLMAFMSLGEGRKYVVSDLVRMSDQLELRLPIALQLIYSCTIIAITGTYSTTVLVRQRPCC